MTRSHYLVIAGVAALFVWCFWRVLFLGETFGFRDASNFYYPLFHWQAAEWGEGRIPLWNPYDDLGTPALAETTSSTLYPGKLIFALPLSYRLQYHIYICAHVLLAAWAAFRLARHWRTSVGGAGVAAVCYAFSGNVLFQYCNVVYLVGASWLPLAVLATDRMVRQGSRGWAVTLGAILALMTLGGDPQTAYHGGLLAVLFAVLARRKQQDGERPSRAAVAKTRFALLALAAIAGFLLAAVQILPAMEWTRHSDRASFDRPRSIYEAVSDQDDVRGGLVGVPEPNTHHAEIYDYSVGPWRLVECVWPNFSGRMFPEHRRWLSAIPAEDRTWTPSLYFGLLPLLFAIGTWRLRGGPAHVRWSSWCVLIGVLASFGWFGIGWVWNELSAATAGDGEAAIGSPVGGLYWLLVVLLPGYAYFRYPAKWLVIAMLGASMLAARGADRWLERPPRALLRSLSVIAVISGVGALAVLPLSGPIKSLWDVEADVVFGPLEADAAVRDLLMAFAHTAVVAGIASCLLRGWVVSRYRFALVLWMTVAEVGIANAWLVATVGPDTMSLAPAVSSNHDGSFHRAGRSNQLPRSWKRASSAERLGEVVAWERETMFAKQHLMVPVGKLDAYSTVAHRDIAALIPMTQKLEDHRARAFLSALSVDELLISSGRALPNRAAYPRAWIVRDVVYRPYAESLSQMDRVRRLRETFFDGMQPRDLRRQSFIDADGPPAEVSLPTTSPTTDSCSVTAYEAQRVEIAVTLSSPGWVVLNDLPYPGWTSALHNDAGEQRANVHRANVVMRAVYVPTGEHTIVYRYRPTPFYTGGLISIVAWIACGAWLLRRRQLDQRQRATHD